MPINKVLYNDTTLLDLTGDTVTPSTLAEGVIAHNASGEQIVGTLPKVTPIERGGTNATNVEDALVNLTLDDVIYNASVSGKKITFTRKNGETVVINTQDTVPTDYITSLSVSGTTITYTKKDGTTGTIKTQDTDTTYTLSSFGITATAKELNILDGVTATTAELNYVDGVTSNIQTQLNNKLSTSGTAVKATADASGNVITTTYATKSEVESATSTAKAYTDTTVANLIGSADSTMDTLGEIQTAMKENASVVEALHEAIGSKASADHTHKYAGSSSVGGAATSANKLNTNAGSSSKPVYFKDGVPVECTYLALEVQGVSEFANKDGAGNVITATYETKANAITGLSVSGKTITYTKGNGTTGTITTQDTNTTYDSMSASEATTGTATTARSITAKVLHDKINEVVTANAYTLPTATSSVLGGVKTGSNITNSSGTISITKDNVTSALGYTPPTTNTTYSNATTSVAGLMSVDDKKKLDGIASGANNYTYTLPTASSSTLGGVKTTSTVTSTSGLTACPIISGVPYYKDSNTTYSLSSFGVTATASELNVLDGITATVTELNYCDGVTSNIQTQLNSKSDSGHTHNYAGSSSAGGAATSANKINTNAGSATQPVYFAKGVPVKTTYTLGASVPSDAKFTDTVYTHPSSHSASMITGLATVATSGKYSDLSGTPTSLPANGGNADTVGGFTVGVNVPANAKFTDTVYTLPNATTSTLGGVKIGSNISISSGTISLTKTNVTNALGYTPPTKDTTYSTATDTTAGIVKLYGDSGENTDGALTQKASNEMFDVLSTGLWSLGKAKADKATTLSGYGITDSYTKTEVDAKISSANSYTICGNTIDRDSNAPTYGLS